MWERLSVQYRLNIMPENPKKLRTGNKRGVSRWFVAHRFDVMPIRIEHECAVVVRVIVGADARWTVINAAGGHRGR